MKHKQLDTARYIIENWHRTVVNSPDDTDTEIGLPYPHTVPAIEPGSLHRLFYWDNYFTNLGLIESGMLDQALMNVENVLSMIGRFSFVPNPNQVKCVEWQRSQVPFCALMVRDIYEQTRDIGRLKASLPLIIEEYDFWMRQRPSPTGLNRFLHGMPESEFGWKFRQIAGRIPALAVIDNEDDRRAAVHHHLAEGESGWDYTSRFEHRCVDFDPVCLNSMLFLYETLLSDFLCATGGDDAGPWRERAEKRKRLMNKLCWCEETGVFTDYDRVNNRRSSVLSAAVFFPLFAGLAGQSQAQRTAAAAAARLEQPWGLSATERVDSACPYQWDFPNAWPPLQHIAVQGLRNYGLDDDAARLARKYIEATDKIFAATGNLWEKYNAVTGDVDVASEYPMPPLLGWSAGVYLWAKRR